jgi:phenylalanyl-tRNA synthetase alpha chain
VPDVGSCACYLGKKGVVTEQLKQLGGLPADERPRVGQWVNEAKELLQELLQSRKQHQKPYARQVARNARCDPPRRVRLGGHIRFAHAGASQALFLRLGFEIADGRRSKMISITSGAQHSGHAPGARHA